MHVGIVVQNDYPHIGEIRPRRLAQSLHKAGHKVTFLAWNSRKNPASEDIGYAEVCRFRYFLKSRYYSFLSSPSPLNPLWLIWIFRAVAKQHMDILILSNIRIALPAILAAKLLGKPVILDLQEHNEENVKLRPKTRLLHYLTRNSYFIGIYERLSINLSDHIWIVIQDRSLSLPAQVINERRFNVVCNTPSLDELDLDNDQHATKNGKFTLIYIGRFTGGIGPVELIMRSLPYVVENDADVRLLIGGVETDRLKMEALIKELNIRDYVDVDGVIKPENVPAWLQQGDVGIIPYDVNSYTNCTISNKLFHYMAAGLPVLSTDMKPTRRVIEEEKCGLVIPEGSSHENIAELILQLKNSPQELALMGERAKIAVREKYNWENDFKIALTSMQKLLFAKRS
jgi:glycosyltransferase involved in cell wall biosynthesis